LLILTTNNYLPCQQPLKQNSTWIMRLKLSPKCSDNKNRKTENIGERGETECTASWCWTRCADGYTGIFYPTTNVTRKMISILSLWIIRNWSNILKNL
jgi:hypothetical protein